MNEQLIAQLAALLGAANPAPAAVENTPAKTKRPPVKLVKHKETGLTINAYENNPEWGYIQVEESSVMQRSRTWIGKVRRTALLKGDIESLKEFVRDNAKNNMLPGCIVVREYPEDQVPVDLFREMIGDPDTRVGGYEEAVAPFVKRAGKDGVELTTGGERIFRFSFYDPTGEEEDQKIDHDNGEEVAEFNKNRRAELARKLIEEKEAAAKLAKETPAPAKETVPPVAETAEKPAALPTNEGKK